jgi:hypothetical protein
MGEGTNEANDREIPDLEQELSDLMAADADSIDDQLFIMQRYGGLEAVREELIDRLDLYGVENRVVDNDVHRQGELFNEYIRTFRDKRLHELFFRKEGIQESDYARVAAEGILAYYEERIIQYIVLHSAAMLSSAVRYDVSAEVAMYTLQGVKKELQADFLIEYGMKPDHPLQVFFNHETPGEGLDPTNPSDKKYIQMSEDDLDKHIVAQAKRRQVVETGREILGMDFETTSEEEIAYATHILLEMHFVASSTLSAHEQANRLETLHEIGRKLGCGYKTLTTLVELFDNNYPTNEKAQAV